VAIQIRAALDSAPLQYLRILAGASGEIFGHGQDAWNSDPRQNRTDVFYLLTSGG
jgi:hypothetical protein